MTGYTDPVGSKKDALLGRIAVDKRLITEEQLTECMQEQVAEAAEGQDPEATLRPTKSVRPLGVVMLSKGLIKEKDLVDLLEEQNRRLQALKAYQKMQKVEYLFGQLLVKNNQATQLQINKCLVKQQEMAEKGIQPIPRLGELLVEFGFVDKATVANVLKLQNKDLLFCTGCGRQFNVVGTKEGMTYKCKACGGVMIRKELLESLRAEDTSFGFELPTEEQ